MNTFILIKRMSFWYLIYALFIIYFLSACHKGPLDGDNLLVKINDKEIKWKKKDIPISVFYGELSIDNINILEQSILELNRIFSGKLFLYPTAWFDEEPMYAPIYTIYIQEVENNSKSNIGGSATYNLDKNQCTILSVDIEIMSRPTEKEEIRTLIMMHELGHSLGLADDYDPCSIMHYFAHSVCRDNKMFSKEDIAIIRKLYL